MTRDKVSSVMISTSVSSEYLAAVKWAEESYSTEEFVDLVKLPQVGKIMKGQLLKNGIGVPTALTPALNQTIFWLRLVPKCKLIGQCVKFKDIRGSNLPRAVSFGPRLEISDDYAGWFEILSEDGRCVRTIDSVAELARRFPLKCLVRENVKVCLARVDSDGQEFLSEKTRVIQVGEVLSLKTIGSFCAKNPSDKYLKCLTSSDEILFMRLDQRGKFSPIAREDSISGVHSVKNLSAKRLPLMTRLVHGSWPSTFKGFQPCIRILSVVQEPVLIGFPLLKDCGQLVELPVTCKQIRLVCPQNASFLTSLTQFSSLIEQGSRACPAVKGIEVVSTSCSSPPSLSEHHRNNEYFSESEAKARIDGDQRCDPHHHYHSRSRCFVSNSPLVMKCMANHDSESNQVEGKENRPSSSESPRSYSSYESSEYDEIDQIYDYIRGIAPLPEAVRRELAGGLWSPPATAAAVTRFQSRYSIPDHRRLSYPSAVTAVPDPPLTKPTAAAAEVPVSLSPDYDTPPLLWCNSVSNRSPAAAAGDDRLRNFSHLPIHDHHHHQLIPKSKLFVKRSTTAALKKSSSSRILPIILKPAGKQCESRSANCPSEQQQQQLQSEYQVVSNAPAAVSGRSGVATPIFNIRYKSMTNISLSPPPPVPAVISGLSRNPCSCSPAMNGTLESSNSGHQTSCSSGKAEAFRDPRPKTRKLSKHKSLNNIFREIASAFSFERMDCETAKSRKNSDGNLSSDRPTTLSSESSSLPANYHNSNNKSNSNDNNGNKKNSLNNLENSIVVVKPQKVGTVYI